MSLLDDVSIVVTPNGYKAGELYAVIPVPVEGSELVDNGTFLTDTTTGWNDWDNLTNPSNSSQQDGYGILDATTGTCDARQDITVEIGKTYLIEATLKEDVNGAGRLYMSDGANYSYAFGNFTATTTETTFKQYVVPTQTAIRLYAYNSGSAKAYFKNISLKEALTVSADMDVTRATAATRVDENGLVNYAEVLGSELVTNGNFDSNITGWSAKDCTIVWDNSKLKADNSSGNQNGGAFQNIGLVTGKTYQMTATMQLLTGSSNGTFNLFTSAAGGTGQTSVYTGSALVVGGAAVTETFYFTPGSGDVSIQFTCDEANATYTIDNVSVKEVTRNNVPRIDYTGGGCPHILAEPQRTNLFTYSEDFSSWSNDNSTDTPNSTTAPDGTLTATEVTEDTATGRHGVFYNIGSQTGTEFSFSAFVKDNNRRYVSIVLSDIATWNSMVVFDLTTGTITKEYTKTGYTGTSSITAIGNGWYRISNTLTGLTFAGSAVYSRIYLQDTPTPANPPSNTYTGDGTSSIYIWGAQLEVGSYPTSYIPTSGSSVTRNQDIFTRDGIGSLINSTEGVLFLEVAAFITTNPVSFITLNDGGGNNKAGFYYNSVLNTIIFEYVVGGATQASFTYTSSNITNFNKVAFSWKLNQFKLFANGSQVGSTDTSGSVDM